MPKKKHKKKKITPARAVAMMKDIKRVTGLSWEELCEKLYPYRKKN